MLCIACGAEMHIARIEQDAAIRRPDTSTRHGNASAVAKQSDGSPLAATVHHGLSNIGGLLRRYPGPSLLACGTKKRGRHYSERRSDAGRGQLRLERRQRWVLSSGKVER
jgi:hypothetical protein